jgi:hypothetical protein
MDAAPFTDESAACPSSASARQPVSFNVARKARRQGACQPPAPQTAGGCFAGRRSIVKAVLRQRTTQQGTGTGLVGADGIEPPTYAL